MDYDGFSRVSERRFCQGKEKSAVDLLMSAPYAHKSSDDGDLQDKLGRVIMITRRSFVSAVAAVVAAPAIVKAQDAPYVLGTLYPMSGLNPDFGEIYTKATVLAVEQIAEEKLLGRPIEIHSQDSQATPQGGAVGMTRLVNVDRAPYVLLGFTGVSKAAAPIGERSKTVMVNGGGVGPDLAKSFSLFLERYPACQPGDRRSHPLARRGAAFTRGRRLC